MKQMVTLPAQVGGQDFFVMAIVAIAVLLVGVLILVLLWQFVTRRRSATVNERPGGASLPPVAENTEMTESAVASTESALAGPGASEKGQPTVSTTATGAQTPEAAATVPAQKNSTKTKIKTQPTPIYRKDGPRPAPDFPVGEPITLPASGQRPPHISWQIAGLTDTGLKRELNEDNLILLEGLMMEDSTPYGVYLVADGMGGHQGGDIASQLTVDSIQEQFTRQPLRPMTPFHDWLNQSVVAANEVVLARQEEHTQEKKMGSTLVMALVTEGQAHIANVGDSRAYHLTDADIQQVSVDHSLVERLIQLGQLTREEARTHKQRNVIYNTIGDKPNPEVGLYHIFLKPGDRLLLCSDGLSGMLPDEEILSISHNQPEPAAACQEMVRAAKTAGGDDNITVIIIEVDA